MFFTIYAPFKFEYISYALPNCRPFESVERTEGRSLKASAPPRAVDNFGRRAQCTFDAGPGVRHIPQKMSLYSAPENCGIPQCIRASSIVLFNWKSQMDSQQQLLEGLLQLVTMVEGERKLLAADLHDQTLSDLRQLAQIARRLVQMPEQELSAELREGLLRIASGLDTAMDEVRRAMESLSP